MPYYPPATGSGITDGDKGDITVSGSGTIFNLDIKPTGAIVGTTDTQTLTNKTLTSPTINDPTLGTGGLIVTGSGSGPSTPTTGFGKITMAGTGAVRPRFINSGGTLEYINTSYTDVIQQSNWGYVQGNGTNWCEVTVTYATAFTTIRNVVISSLGLLVGSVPTTIGSFNAGYSGNIVLAQAYNITATGFVCRMTIDSSVTIATNLYLGFSWIAYGS